MAFTLQDLQGQFSSLFGGGGGDISSYAGAPNTGGASLDLSGAAGASTPGMFSGGGMNLGTAGMALGGLQALGNLLQGQKAFKLAKDQFRFQKEFSNANLNNSMKSYNNTLEDRLKARGFAEGRDAGETAAEIERKRLSR